MAVARVGGFRFGLSPKNADQLEGAEDKKSDTVLGKFLHLSRTILRIAPVEIAQMPANRVATKLPYYYAPQIQARRKFGSKERHVCLAGPFSVSRF